MPPVPLCLIYYPPGRVGDGHTYIPRGDTHIYIEEGELTSYMGGQTLYNKGGGCFEDDSNIGS